MTEEIDLDELDVDSDDEQSANPGDWFWRGEGDPDDEPEVDVPDSPSVEPGDADTETEPTNDGTDKGTDTGTARVPHVPRENKDKPVGIPVEGGGAGANAASDAASEPPDHGEPADGDAAGADGEASGPHGGDADEMTMALTYEAMKRLDNPQRVVADANAWADWVGIVGDVGSHVINKFQRDHRIDVDFFNGSSQGPAERLASVDETSMFYAERMVLVGFPDEGWMAEAEEWEFVPLSEAAGKADWGWSDDS
ncbi:hypothetical protein BRD09_06140 [Halobacteriales archaeon SW_10_68_16]|jgi:hypothetical protein|nr:MAG: hypothetical protein BRD09_06140 [Halobacteriales archaeon SW_10_68_16]